MLVSSPFQTQFFLVTFILSSANALNFDRSNIFPFDEKLNSWLGHIL